MTAVAPVVVDCGGIWVGWTGLDDFKEGSDVIPESPEDDRTPTAGLKSEQAMPVSVQPGGCGGEGAKTSSPYLLLFCSTMKMQEKTFK